MEPVKVFDGWITAPGMESDQQITTCAVIGLLDFNLVT